MALLLAPSHAVAHVLTLSETAALVRINHDRSASAGARHQALRAALALAQPSTAPAATWSLRARATFIIGAAFVCWVPPIVLALQFT